jgi:hypothetical protein
MPHASPSGGKKGTHQQRHDSVVLPQSLKAGPTLTKPTHKYTTDINDSYSRFDEHIKAYHPCIVVVPSVSGRVAQLSDLESATSVKKRFDSCGFPHCWNGSRLVNKVERSNAKQGQYLLLLCLVTLVSLCIPIRPKTSALDNFHLRVSLHVPGSNSLPCIECGKIILKTER